MKRKKRKRNKNGQRNEEDNVPELGVICKWGEEAYEKVEYRRKWESLNRRIITHPKKKKGNEDRKKRKNHFVLSNASEPVMPQEPNKSKLAKGEKKREKREK